MHDGLAPLLAELETIEEGDPGRWALLVEEISSFGLDALESLVQGQAPLSHMGMHLSQDVVSAIRDPLAIPMLVSLLTQTDRTSTVYALAAEEALKQIGSPAIPALTPNTPWAHGMDTVCGILAAIGDTRSTVPLVGWMEDGIRSGDVTDMPSIIWALGRLGAVEALNVALAQPQADIRIAAINALPHTRPESQTSSVHMLHDPEASVRQCAALWLMKWGDPTSIPELEACLQDGDRRVRRTARNAIGAIRARMNR